VLDAGVERRVGLAWSDTVFQSQYYFARLHDHRKLNRILVIKHTV
jgi:hypothetical protein